MKIHWLLPLTIALAGCAADKVTKTPIAIDEYPFDQSFCPAINGGFHRNNGREHFSISKKSKQILVRDRGVLFIVDGHSHHLDGDNAYAATCKDSHIFIHIRSRAANSSGDDIVIFYTRNPLQARKVEMIRGVIENGKKADLASYIPEVES